MSVIISLDGVKNMFIGRENEIKEIKESLDKHSYQGVFVYGRRRIGKTELIQQGIKDCSYRILSFEFRKTTLMGNLNLFVDYVKAFFNEDYLSFNSFDSLFDYLFRKSLEQEYVLVLDEFSFLLSEDFSIESSLAVAIDKYKNDSKIHLFISGSYIGLMEKMISQNSHSYGRFNHIISLKPFDYYDSSKFYSSYSSEDKIMIYSVFGGIPYFNSLIDTNKSALDNIYDLLIKADSICEHEINEIVMMETTKVPLLNELLLTIIRGKNKYSDINEVFLSQNKSKPDYFIEKLIDMSFIEKVFSINDPNNKKRIRYVIKDNLVDFYYRYLFIAKNKELRNNPEFYYENFIKEDFLNKYIPHKFESISKEFLIRMNIANKIKPAFFEIGEYFYNNTKKNINRQFDVVTKDKNGYISYECKYINDQIDESVIREEEYQTSDLPDIKFYKLGFISKNGFSKTIDRNKYNLFELKEFFKS